MLIDERPEPIKIGKKSSFIDVYADCETIVEAEGYEWTEDKEKRDLIFRNCGVVIPWLLCFNLPRCGYDVNGKAILLNGRETICTLFPHEDFFKSLRQLCDLGFVPIIWFHNTTYDITSLFPSVLKKLDPDAEIYLHVKDCNNDFLAGSVYSPRYGFKALLGDTMKYKKISLGKVGEMFKFPKGSVIYTMTDLEIIDGIGHYRNWETGELGTFKLVDYEEYCRRDVDLLVKYHGYINKFKLQLYHAVLGKGKNEESIKALSTVGEQAKKMFDCFIYRHVRGNFDSYFRPKVERLEYYRQFKSNNGGFTSMSKVHPFYRCKENEKIFYIDINGSYPHVMSLGLPYGELLGVKPKSGGYFTWIRVQVNNFEWVGLFSDLTKEGISKDRFKKFDDEDFDPDDWYAEKEIYIPEEVFNFLKEHARIKYKYRGKFYQRITQIAGKYMEFINNIRKEYRERAQNHPDEMERLLSDEIQKNIKIAANSNYGKFCQQSYTRERFYLGDMFADYLKKEDEIDYRGTLTGAYVTWMARLKLFKKIEEIKKAGFTFLYCDTDSIIGVYDVRREDKLNSIVGINTNELGQWKVEGYFDEYAYLVSKKYMLLDYESPEKSKFVFSGIDKLDIWIKAFKEGLINRFEETLTVLRGIFDHNQNWVFLESKKTNIKTLNYSQTIIRISDFNTNARLKVKKIRHGEIWLTSEGYGYKLLN